MTAHADASAARPSDVAGGERDIHKRAVGTVVVVAPDEALLIGEHRPATPAALLRLGDQGCGLADVVGLQPGDLCRFVDAHLVRREHLVEAGGRLADEGLVEPSLGGDLGHQRIEEDKVGAGPDGQVKDVRLARGVLASVDGHRAPRIDDDDARRLVRLVGELLLLMSRAG